jgi:hypothetical protein
VLSPFFDFFQLSEKVIGLSQNPETLLQKQNLLPFSSPWFQNRSANNVSSALVQKRKTVQKIFLKLISICHSEYSEAE